MTLLRLEPSHQVAVLEMSMYTEGEIARLAEIARPEVGVVLAVHPTHLERAGSLEAIARAKAELPARRCPPDGLAVLNADDPRVAAMRRHDRAPTVRTFGLAPGADVRATDVESRGRGRHELHPRGAVGRPPAAHRATPGRHLVPHALAAAAVAEHFGVPLDEVEAALEAGSRAPHRMAVVEARRRRDRSSTTPTTPRRSRSAAALDFLAETPARAGPTAVRRAGRHARARPRRGAPAPRDRRARRRPSLDGAGGGGGARPLDRRGAHARRGWRGSRPRRDADEALTVSSATLAPGVGDLLLVKASRGIELDRLVAALSGAARG